MGTPKVERFFLFAFTCFLCTFGGVQEATTTHQSSVEASCDIEPTMETAHCFAPTYEANKEYDYNTTYSIDETDSGKVSDGTLCVLNSGYPKAIKCQGGEWITSKIPGHITESLSTAMDKKLLERQKRLTSDLCPVGSYSRDGREPHCELCPLGTYQSYRGQTSCDKCSPGWITEERGATSNLKCFRDSQVSGHFFRGIFYYDTTCNKSVDALEEKFTQAANDSSILNGTCTAGNATCELTNINVTCGLWNGIPTYEAKFTITVTPEDPNSFSVNKWTTLGENIYENFRQNVYVADKYDLINDFSRLYTENLQCDGARQVRYSDPNLPPLCVPCGKGYFFNGSTTLCHACPLDTYQPDEEARICKTCPGNSTTKHTASKDLSDCLDLCPVGSYSRDGREPHCELCHLGTYQSNRGQTSCDECPPGWITDKRGATSNLQCHKYDVCVAKPCGAHGTCISRGIFSWICHCDAHWLGDKCQTPTDFCASHPCANGATCENVFEKGVPTYRCLCADGFKGDLCQETIVHGGWGSWLEWSQCSKSCPGTQTRRRVCDSPPPGPEGRPCEEPSTETIECNVHCSDPSTLAIPVDGQLTQWSPWQCSVTCGYGQATRRRFCTPPKNGGLECKGKLTNFEECVRSPCPIDGGYSEFSRWSECSKSCGEGQSVRSRSCISPKPSYGGRNCERLGPKDERRPCKVLECSSVDCTPGTYWSSNSCKKCPRDQYQDYNGQNNCIPCPEGTSTEDIGSHSIDQCKDNNGGKVLGGMLPVMLISFLGGLFFGAVIAVWFNYCKASSQRSSTPNRAITVEPLPNCGYPTIPQPITGNQVAPPAYLPLKPFNNIISSTPNRAITVEPLPNYGYPTIPQPITGNQVAPPADLPLKPFNNIK